MMSSERLQRTLRRAYQLHRDGHLQRAVALYARVLTQEPGHPGALHYAALLGRQLNDNARANGQPTRDDEVMRLMAMSVAAAPTNAAGIHNFAKFKHDRGELDDAKQLYENAVAVDPGQGESWTSLGNIYGELGNRMRAEACWQRAAECEPASDDARFNLSFLKLLKGDFAAGWRDYESRWKSPTFIHSYGRGDLRMPPWTGERVHTLYLHQEQGAGDALMMARYIPLALERAGRVIVEVIRGLVPLFEAMFPGMIVVARGDAPPRHDAQLPMLSLPAVFGTALDTIPKPAPFWPNSVDGVPIAMEPGRIGLCWRGSTTHTNDRVRSMPYEACFPLLDVDGLTWQSLQFGYDVGPPVASLPSGDFLETARQIARCALVITVDTSVAHLAASMDVPTWILLPFSAEWRWLQDRSDSPWYRSAQLWRQQHAGDWRELTKRVAVAIGPRVSLHQETLNG